MSVDYYRIIQTYLKPNSLAYRLYTTHVTLVTQMALRIARKRQLSPEQQQFIEEASMLHDIGIHAVQAPDIDCHGTEPYIKHGVIGRAILEAENLRAHALVCERHTGVGLTKEEIIEQKLPLPHRDLLPVSLEEQIICYADCWYSKHPERVWKQYTYEHLREWFGKYPHAEEKIKTFSHWHEQFGE